MKFPACSGRLGCLTLHADDAYVADLLSNGVDIALEFGTSEVFTAGWVKLEAAFVKLAKEPVDSDGRVRI